MTHLSGLNVPADGRLSAEWCAEQGAAIVRVVLTSHFDLDPWMADCYAHGLQVLGVIARESLAPPMAHFAAPAPAPPALSYPEYLERIRTQRMPITQSAPLPSESMPFSEAAQYYASRYPALAHLQVGNEPDLESPSSWTMTPSDLNDLLAAFNMTFPTATIVGPGLASGQPAYLDGVNGDLADFWALHPYGRRASDQGDWSELPGNFGDIQGLFDAYRPYGKDLWITEWGLTTTEASEAFHARYVGALVPELRHYPECPIDIYFCSDDAMVPCFGLYRADGSAKPAAGAYQSAANPSSPGDPIMPESTYTVGPGVLAEMQKHGDTPGSDECYYPIGAKASQWSETMALSGAIYRYLFAANQTFRFPPS